MNYISQYLFGEAEDSKIAYQSVRFDKVMIHDEKSFSTLIWCYKGRYKHIRVKPVMYSVVAQDPFVMGESLTITIPESIKVPVDRINVRMNNGDGNDVPLNTEYENDEWIKVTPTDNIMNGNTLIFSTGDSNISVLGGNVVFDIEIVIE